MVVWCAVNQMMIVHFSEVSILPSVCSSINPFINHPGDKYVVRHAIEWTPSPKEQRRHLLSLPSISYSMTKGLRIASSIYWVRGTRTKKYKNQLPMVSMIRKEPATPGLYYFERTRNPWSLLLRKSPHPLVSMIMKEPATPGIYYYERTRNPWSLLLWACSCLRWRWCCRMPRWGARPPAPLPSCCPGPLEVV